MLKIVTFLCFVACSVGASALLGGSNSDGRIVGGNSTTGGSSPSISQYPYHVSVQYYGSHICGGSIISDNWVLTAAHCMVYTTSGYTIRAGTSRRGSGGSVHSVSTAIRHGSYSSSTYDYDVAVIRISGSFTFGTNVGAASLATSVPASGSTAVFTGWGSALNSPLEATNVTILSTSECSSYYGSVSSRMVCTKGKDDCQGNSGGALAASGVQIGISSWGYSCSRPEYPQVYTSVPSVRSWILSNTGI